MTWKPVSLEHLKARLESDLGECTALQKALFQEVRITPARWSCHPFGDDGGGFWAVAVRGREVVWYNDIEDGFNVSGFDKYGDIPAHEYWCNQDHLAGALWRLQKAPRIGGDNPAPESI